jgi:predicted small lipoprotein YifL
MKNIVRSIVPVVALVALSAALAGCASKAPTAAPKAATPTVAATPQAPLSPAATAETKLDGADLTVHYSSPAMRGRVIMGGLVPYGQVWRTGANEATSFVTTGNLKVGTLHVPAGKYTIYTMPAAPGKPWELIVNKQTGQWGTVYKKDMDLGRTPMHYSKLSAPQESMTISFEKTTKKSTELHVKWETTDVSVKIEATK